MSNITRVTTHAEFKAVCYKCSRPLALCNMWKEKGEPPVLYFGPCKCAVSAVPDVPPEDTLVSVRYMPDMDWCPRYSAGRLDSTGGLACYADGTTSKTAGTTLPTSWPLWKILEEPTQ